MPTEDRLCFVVPNEDRLLFVWLCLQKTDFCLFCCAYRKQWSVFHIGSGVWLQKLVECVSHRKRRLDAESSGVCFT